MTQTLFEKLTATAEGQALARQEALILEITEQICGLMNQQGVSRAELASRLGKSRAHVTQLLDGRTNMTLRTIADVFDALGASLKVTAMPANAPATEPEPEPEPEMEPVRITLAPTESGDRSFQISTTVTEAPKGRSTGPYLRLVG